MDTITHIVWLGLIRRSQKAGYDPQAKKTPWSP